MTHFICFILSNGRHDVYHVTMVYSEGKFYGMLFFTVFSCMGVGE